MPSAFQQPAVQLSNQFAALSIGSDQRSPPGPGGTAPNPAAHAIMVPLMMSGGSHPFFGTQPPQQQPGQQSQHHQQQPPPPMEPPAAVQAACHSRRALEVLLRQADPSMFSQHERRDVLAFLKAELLDGYADAIKDQQEDFDRARTKLREHYDLKDLAVRV
jgi:hypothetical protein